MKTTNLIINLDHDEWIMSDHSKDKTLSEIGARKSSLQFVPSLPSLPFIYLPFTRKPGGAGGIVLIM
jgi:hypothetical protein